MGSNESHFIVLLIVRDNVTRQCPGTTTDFSRERRAEADLPVYATDKEDPG